LDEKLFYRQYFRLKFIFVTSDAAEMQFSRAISSAGLEHYLDKVGVTGSNPVLPTILKLEVSSKSY
jgi:hypothetical protein